MPVRSDSPHVKFLLYGEPGVGKSVLVGTSPDCLILCNDPDETTSAAIHGSTANRWHVQDYTDLTEAYEYLRHEKHGFSWVWLDNLTLFQEQGMDQIMLDLISEKPHRNQFVPDKAEYLQNQNRLGTLIRNLKALPLNFGVTCHVMRTEDQDGKVVYLPLLQGGQGAFSQKICGYMGVVGYMAARGSKTGSTERILITDKRGKFYAKDRYSSLGGRVVNPTIPEMMSKIQSKLQDQGTPVPASTRRKVTKK